MEANNSNDPNPKNKNFFAIAINITDDKALYFGLSVLKYHCPIIISDVLKGEEKNRAEELRYQKETRRRSIRIDLPRHQPQR